MKNNTSETAVWDDSCPPRSTDQRVSSFNYGNERDGEVANRREKTRMGIPEEWSGAQYERGRVHLAALKVKLKHNTDK